MKGYYENSTPVIYSVLSYKVVKRDDGNYTCNIAIGGSHYEYPYSIYDHKRGTRISSEPWIQLDDSEVHKVYDSLSSFGKDNAKLVVKMAKEDETTPVVYKKVNCTSGARQSCT